jgi:hypothetical protein
VTSLLEQHSVCLVSIKLFFFGNKKESRQICLSEIRLSEQNIIHGNPFSECFVHLRR